MKTRHLMVVIYVRDMARAVAFYRDGLALQLQRESPGWSQLSCGDAFVGLHALDAAAAEAPVPFAGLNLEVEDLDAAIEHVRAHGATLVEVREAEPHVPVRLGVMLDPDGNGFELRQYVR
jgi:catechol 2,3-dioxygenase-like lactoylglutathione lyase family enzyme